ncbi:flagellar hook-length control protein FliK [Butyrivibrio proteoclasticus]|uniref:flagellar hook-length control protein FliK n=1 Tax=Butyrivibrio proteoclasticus TaxID=43305 RepID=UPI0004793DE5|nr:flagellar hook-length control protein FliK [Butyrivibrio proteoclasticus]
MSGVGNVSQSNMVQVDGRYLESSGKEPVAIELKRGSVIKGTIMSVSDTEEGKIANINIGDAVISAKLTDGMGLREGQTLSFSIRGTSRNGVTLLPLLENTSTLQSTIKALNAAGIEVNDKNIQLVKEMMEHNLPIDKDSLQDMAKTASTYADADITTLVEMKSLNIPINDKNIVQYESYKNYEHQVLGELEEVVEELPKALDTLMENGETAKAVNIYGSVLKMVTSGEGAEKEAALALEAENTELVSKEPNEAAKGEAAAKEAIDDSKQAPESAKDNALKLLQELSEGEKLKEGVQDKGQGDSSFNNSIKEFGDKLRNVGFSDNDINSLMDKAQQGKFSETDLLNELNKAFEKADLSNKSEVNAWKNVFSDDTFKNLLKDKISSQWLIKPEDVTEKENVDHLYQRINNQVKNLSNMIQESGLAGTKVSQAVNNLQNNLDFMNQINQMFQYVQLPLMMAGQNTHGDLYVYRNKNKKMSEDGSVSAVLHLDMEHLGPLDVYVKMLDKKVTTNFYVADDSILDLINDNIDILNERLSKRGYTMQVTMKLLDDFSSKDAAVDEMFDVTKMPILSTTSFDARA